ncbi:MAG TPA: hypothetical protein VFB68_11335 [Xanthobacteraceae bacterium]|nr:hypothetical protein [Xanthobacteraceae bacterium]
MDALATFTDCAAASESAETVKAKAAHRATPAANPKKSVVRIVEGRWDCMAGSWLASQSIERRY